MSDTEENEKKIVNSAIDAAVTEQQTEMVTIPRADYNGLVKASMLSLQNALNTMNDFDSIISSLMNVQIFVMNLKDAQKKSISGIKNQQNSSDKPIEQ